MKITALRLRELVGTLEHLDDFWEDRLIRPIDVYPEHQAESAYTGFWHPIKLDDGRYRMQLVFLGTSGYHATDRRQTTCLMLPEASS